MIDAKKFMEFFEKECNVRFIDMKTGKKALGVLSEENNKIPYSDPAYKSDYDRLLEINDDGNANQAEPNKAEKK